MTQKRYRYYLAAIVSLATLSLYLVALRHEFVIWDDPEYVLNNYQIRSLDWAFLRWAFSTFYASNWHPLTWISHALDYAVWGLNPFGHHLTNIVLHAANTFLVVILYMKLRDIWTARTLTSVRADAREGQRGLIAAGVAGLLFGMHPVHVESVAWVSERKDLLCGLFYLLSLLTYANYVRLRGGGPGTGQLRSIRSLLQERTYLLSIAFCMLALMSKPMAVSLPVVLLILDWYPFKRFNSLASFQAAFLEKLPFILLSTIVAILTIMAQRTGGAMSLMSIVPLWGRVLVAAKALIAYLGHMAMPVGLSPFYPYPKPQEIAHVFPRELTLYLLVIAIIAILYSKMRDRAFFLAAAAYYVVTLIPTLGILQVGVQSMADRYTYLPSLGPFFIVGSVSAWGWDRSAMLKQWARPARYCIAFAGASLLVFLSLATLRQVSIWKNSIDLWSFVIEHNSDDDAYAFAYMNRGLAYAEKGNIDLAMKDYDRTIALDPSYAQAYINRGVLYGKLGQQDRAREDYDAAIARDPSNGLAYYNRGIVFGELGQVQRAIEDYSVAIKLNSSFPSAFSNRGMLFDKMGRYDLAIEDFTTAISLRPGYTDDHIRRGRAFKEQGLFILALEDYTTAIALDPGSAEAFNGRGVVYKHLEQFEQAMADFDKAIALNSSFYQAYCNRAVVLGRMGHDESAVSDYSKALSLRPDLAQIYVERGQLYTKTGKRGLAMRDYRKACAMGGKAGCDALRTYR
jgi:tetratricopeptide (TPR) repeat protein